MPDDPTTAPYLRENEQEHGEHESAPAFDPPTDFQIMSEAIDRLMLVPGQVVLLHKGDTMRIIWLLKQRLIDVMNEVRNRTGLTNMYEKKCTALEIKQRFREERVDKILTRFHNDYLTEQERNDLDQELQELEQVNNQASNKRAGFERALRDLETEQNTMYYRIFLSIQQALEDTGLLEPVPVITDDTEEDEPPAKKSKSSSHRNSSIAVSNDELFRRAAVNRVEDLERALHRAESHFDDREQAYNEHYDAWDRAMQTGHCSRTLTDVDLECVLEISKRARQLREAEEDYEAAVVTARRLKVLPVHFDRESNFVSGPDDGYRESAEAELSATVDRKFIRKWTEQVATMAACRGRTSGVGTADSEDEAVREPEEWDEREVDEWEVRSVGMSDSVSVVDCSRNRKRIDAWRKIAGW